MARANHGEPTMADLCRLVQRAPSSSAGAKDSGRRGGPQKLGHVIAEVIAKRGYGQVQKARAEQDAWSRVAPAAFAASTRVGKRRRGVLEILVASNALLQELLFQKQTLLAALQAAWPDGDVRDLKFRAVTF